MNGYVRAVAHSHFSRNCNAGVLDYAYALLVWKSVGDIASICLSFAKHVRT